MLHLYVYGLSLFFFKTHKDLVIYTYDAQILTDGHSLSTYDADI